MRTNISLTRQQLDLLAVSTTAVIRFKRSPLEGRQLSNGLSSVFENFNFYLN